jgi:hypothetical protein
LVTKADLFWNEHTAEPGALRAPAIDTERMWRNRASRHKPALNEEVTARLDRLKESGDISAEHHAQLNGAHPLLSNVILHSRIFRHRLSRAPESVRKNWDVVAGWDSVIQDIAKTNNRPMADLRDVLEGFDIYSDHCEDEQTNSKLLMDTMDTFLISPSEMRTAIEQTAIFLWQGDINAYESYFEHEKTFYTVQQIHMRCFVPQQNKKWAERVVSVLKAYPKYRNNLIVAGANHFLEGPHGPSVQKNLELADFEVRRIDWSKFNGWPKP